MNQFENRPERKSPRLKSFDYREGYYFVTVCSDGRKQLFSEFVSVIPDAEPQNCLKPFGQIAEKQLLDLPRRYSNVVIDKYVIMPNHIHAIIAIEYDEASKAPTLSEIICAFKSLTTRECKRIHEETVVFQKSYHDHVIRNQYDYTQIWNYIHLNPQKWVEDCFYVK